MSLLDKAALIVERMIRRGATRSPDRCLAESRLLTDAQARAALALMVYLDRERQRGPVRFTIDSPTLDRLAEAADDAPNALGSAVLSLDADDAREALCELLLLHHDLTAVELHARRSAALN